jgi:hypothetical protein
MPARAPRSELYAAVLGGTLTVAALSFAVLPARFRIWVMLFSGVSAAAVLGAFAVHHRLSLRGRVSRRGEPTLGAIRESAVDGGGTVLRLPGQGLEPWGSDAWTILVATLTLTGIAGALDAANWALFGFVLALNAVLGWRLHAARQDFIRIELADDRWAIDALEGGRTVHVSGRAPLLPELLPEALLLWSEAGRIGTIRWELTPEERAWLAARLASLAAARGSLADARDEVDEGNPEHDRQRQQSEQAE